MCGGGGGCLCVWVCGCVGGWVGGCMEEGWGRVNKPDLVKNEVNG